jgi:hypothetical protein
LYLFLVKRARILTVAFLKALVKNRFSGGGMVGLGGLVGDWALGDVVSPSPNQEDKNKYFTESRLFCAKGR